MLLTYYQETLVKDLPTNLPNELLWWHIALMLVVGGAITMWGLSQMVKKWEQEANVPGYVKILTDICGLILCMVLGYLVGGRVWDPILGLACATCGAFGYHYIVMIVIKFFKKRGWIDDNGNRDSKSTYAPDKPEEDDTDKRENHKQPNLPGI